MREQRVGDSVRIVFKDRGQGIAREDARFLFKKFWRGGSRTFVPGSGLGLCLCGKIVRAHGGGISAEYRGDSQGQSNV